jgi:hypothetical protein
LYVAVCLFFLNFDAKLEPNLMQIFPNSTKKVHSLHHCRKFMQKGADTKMHKYLFWKRIMGR